MKYPILLVGWCLVVILCLLLAAVATCCWCCRTLCEGIDWLLCETAWRTGIADERVRSVRPGRRHERGELPWV